MFTLFGRITQLLNGVSATQAAINAIGIKVDSLTTKLNAVAADVAAVHAAQNPDQFQLLNQTVSDIQSTVINIQVALGSAE